MNNTVKHTPIGEVMAHFNLSDAEWDGLPSFVQQKLATVYYQHAAAPAMYEALQTVLYGLENGDDYEGLVPNIRQALAQAEGR